jgi:hypothetical protein
LAGLPSARTMSKMSCAPSGLFGEPDTPVIRPVFPSTADPTLSQLLDYVMQDEGRHVNFGYFALKRAIPSMEPSKREYLEDFCFKACDLLYSRDERTGFQSIKQVWREMGWDADKIWRDTVANSQTTKHFNSFLFGENLMPRLVRLGLISERIAPKYRDIGLLSDAGVATAR